MTPGPYHLFSMGVLLILSYLASLAQVQIQLLRKQNHRKFWNLVLLFFFISTALAGMRGIHRRTLELNPSLLPVVILLTTVHHCINAKKG